MRRLMTIAGALCVVLLTGTGSFAQVPPADPNNPNENVPEASSPPPYGVPIDLATAKKAAEGAAEGKGTPARVMWVHRAGATVKVELEVEGTGQLVVVELPRGRYAELQVERGDRVLAVPREARVFSADYQI